MKINNGLFSYPVLSNYRRDYTDASFTVKVKHKSEFEILALEFNFEIKNVPEIQDLINKGKAAFCIHLECSPTSYRECIMVDSRNFSKRIPFEKLAKNLDVSTFIVAKEPIKQFYAEKFNTLYDDMKFDIDEYQIMAIGNSFKIPIVRQEQYMDKNQSIIRYRKLDDADGNLKVITDGEYIIVGIPEKMYELVCSLGENIFRQSVMSMIAVPTMIIVLTRMYDGRNDESWQEKHWHQVISELLKANGYNIEDFDLQSDDMFELVQKIFHNPISNAVVELNEMSERVD